MAEIVLITDDLVENGAMNAIGVLAAGLGEVSNIRTWIGARSSAAVLIGSAALSGTIGLANAYACG